MSAGPSRRPPPDEPENLGDEVVEDVGYEVVDAPPPTRPAPPPAARLNPAPPARPLPAAPTPARVVRPTADPGFEVVAPASSAAKPKSKPKIRVVDDADTEERPAKTKRSRVIEENEDDRTDEEDRPRKRRKKRRGRVVEGKPSDEEENNFLVEWGAPGFLTLVGLVMLVIGTWGQAKSPEAAIASPIVAVILMVIMQLIAIPITIVALMIIGSLFGIEYGTLLSAVRNLAAMSFLVNGLIAVFQWAGIIFFIYEPIILLIGIGLFMTLFRLDVWETMVTMFMLNVMSWVLQFIALVLILMILSRAADRMDQDAYDSPRDRNRPSQVDRDRPPAFDPDDLDDPDDLGDE